MSCSRAHLADEVLHLELRARVETRSSARRAGAAPARSAARGRARPSAASRATGAPSARCAARAGSRRARGSRGSGRGSATAPSRRSAPRSRGSRPADIFLKNEASTETRLTRRRTARSSETTSWPKTRAEPPSGRSSVESTRTSVDFPEPFWPEDGDALAALDREADVLDRGHAALRREAARAPVTAEKLLAQIENFDGEHVRRLLRARNGHEQAAHRPESGGARGDLCQPTFSMLRRRVLNAKRFRQGNSAEPERAPEHGSLAAELARAGGDRRRRRSRPPRAPAGPRRPAPPRAARGRGPRASRHGGRS